MSAMEELRQSLDRLGTEHTDLGGMTEWTGAGGRICRAYTRNEPLTVDVAILAVPPAQAVEATLGRGTCEWNLEHSGTLYDKWRCSECGFLFVESRTDNGIKEDFDPNYCPNCGAKVEGETE